MAERIHCFPPVINSQTQVLILGSLPGEMSLGAGEYYANPQNHFWRLLGSALGISFLPRFSYENRLRLMQHLGVGIWSSIESGEREGTSLDAQIRNVQSTDLLKALIDHDIEGLAAVLFDGRLAEKVFMKQTLCQLPPLTQRIIAFEYLPSSSAAYAAMGFEHKARMWNNRIRKHLDHFSKQRNR